ncbi:hypothetical protein F5Y10DRAFT_234221 [Nemania abortiva]|nr:hypothetical protein F5Y10DRAFT_234221 [Nemania abortiva]
MATYSSVFLYFNVLLLPSSLSYYMHPVSSVQTTSLISSTSSSLPNCYDLDTLSHTLVDTLTHISQTYTQEPSERSKGRCRATKHPRQKASTSPTYLLPSRDQAFPITCLLVYTYITTACLREHALSQYGNKHLRRQS